MSDTFQNWLNNEETKLKNWVVKEAAVVEGGISEIWSVFTDAVVQTEPALMNSAITIIQGVLTSTKSNEISDILGNVVSEAEVQGVPLLETLGENFLTSLIALVKAKQ